jgi:hypothetical protein
MKFYDESRMCPKCGYEVVGTIYIHGLLKRDCRRCLHGWYERPLDEAKS